MDLRSGIFNKIELCNCCNNDVTIGLIKLEVNKNKHQMFSFRKKYPFPAHYFLFPTMSTKCQPTSNRQTWHSRWPLNLQNGVRGLNKMHAVFTHVQCFPTIYLGKDYIKPTPHNSVMSLFLIPKRKGNTNLLCNFQGHNMKRKHT